MKKTLKILLIFALVAIFSVILKNNASAIYVDGEETIGYDGSNVTVTKDESGVYNLQLTGDTNQDLIIRDGETVVLDLNGHTFENFTLECEAIKVLEGGTLTIKDSAGAGKLTVKDGSSYALIENNGTLVIDGGTYTQKAWSAIINNGTATINNGTFEQTDSANWSLIDNKGNLTIKNGSFSEGDEYYLIRNESVATINGGTFTTKSPATSLIGNYVENKTEDTKISLNITNGTFSAPSIVINNYAGYELNISGGEFTSTNHFAVNNWGICTITGGTLTSENNSAVRVVYTSGEDKPVMNISNDVTMNSVDGKENIAIENTSSEVNVSTGVDENGNTVAGELAITAEAVTCEEGATIGMKVTVSIGGVEIIPDNLKIVSSDENVIKVNDDNTITGVTAGTTSLTATYKNVSVQVAANVTEKETETPEDPTTPEEPTDTDEPTDEEETTKPGEEEIVQTGDYIYIAIGAVILIVIANVIYTVKKKNRK